MADTSPPRPEKARHDYLRRLDPAFYRGTAFVHWSMSVADRRRGWLDASAHSIWRETLLHTLGRHLLTAPVYCLMPDHVHVLLVGLGASSDQRGAAGFLRRFSRPMLTRAGAAWQKQSFDHVLRESERERGAFKGVAHYIAENPVRAKLAAAPEDWPYSGSLVLGWPDLDWRRADFWEHFWSIFNAAVEPRPDRT
jgi:putative transposase